MQTHLSHQEKIQQVELTIEQARKVMEMGDAIARLENNDDFKKVIFDGYFVDEAARLTSLLAEPSLQAAEKQSRILHGLRGISELKQHLLTTKMMVEQFKHELDLNLEELEELRAEVPGVSTFGED